MGRSRDLSSRYVAAIVAPLGLFFLITIVGGIVTFTPASIIQGHFRLLAHIKKIKEHPLWECYVLPSVVAMVAKLTCQGKHTLRVYDE